MSATLATVASPLADKLVTLVLSTSTEEDNVTGASGTLYGIEIDNTLNTVACYAKFVNTADVTSASNSPMWKFYGPASTKQTYLIPAGSPFSVGLSGWVTTTTANGTTQAYDGTGNITVPLLCD